MIQLGWWRIISESGSAQNGAIQIPDLNPEMFILRLRYFNPWGNFLLFADFQSPFLVQPASIKLFLTGSTTEGKNSSFLGGLFQAGENTKFFFRGLQDCQPVSSSFRLRLFLLIKIRYSLTIFLA